VKVQCDSWMWAGRRRLTAGDILLRWMVGHCDLLFCCLFGVLFFLSIDPSLQEGEDAVVVVFLLFVVVVDKGCEFFGCGVFSVETRHWGREWREPYLPICLPLSL